MARREPYLIADGYWKDVPIWGRTRDGTQLFIGESPSQVSLVRVRSREEKRRELEVR